MQNRKITIEVSENQLKAFNSTMIDVLSYYSTLKNNSLELKNLRETTELSNIITTEFYNSNFFENKTPNSYNLDISKLELTPSIIKSLKNVEIHTVGDLVSYTAKGLYNIKKFRSQNVKLIEEVLLNMGLKLSQAEDFSQNKMENFPSEENLTIDSFFKNLTGLKDFVKNMRVKGFFGKYPHKQEDLDMQVEILQQLDKINFFVKDVINKFK